MMDVLLVYYKKTNTVVAVLEHTPGELTCEDIKGKWLATMGMTVGAANDFRIDYAPVVPAKSWQKFEPIFG